MPLASYRIPGLLLTPEKAWQGRRIDRLCSQIDLAPTLLSLAGIAHQSPFFGDDLLLRPTGPGRALLQHNRDIAIMDDHHLWMFGLQQHRQRFQRTGPYGTELSPLPPPTTPPPKPSNASASAPSKSPTNCTSTVSTRCQPPADDFSSPKPLIRRTIAGGPRQVLTAKSIAEVHGVSATN